MPLLEVIQTRQISASIRLSDTTATQVDQYAAFIRACADDVVEQALTYVFSKDRDFQDFLKTPEARRVAATLYGHPYWTVHSLRLIKGFLLRTALKADVWNQSAMIFEHSPQIPEVI